MRITLPLRPNCNVSCATLRRCLDEVKDWMADNLVKLNERKRQPMVFGRSVFNKAESDILGPWTCYLQDRVRNLGVIFNSSLKFGKKNCSLELFHLSKGNSQIKIISVNK